jgi:hypothetical protein
MGVELNDLRLASREPTQVSASHFTYTLPDGRLWLDARRS